MTKPAAVFVLACLAVPASAEPTAVDLDGAKVLVRALTLTTLKPKAEKTKRTWSIKVLVCTTKNGVERWELPVTVCEADGKKLTGAPAVLLQEAMGAAKITAPYFMYGARLTANDVTCVNDERYGEHGHFWCTYTAVGRAP